MPLGSGGTTNVVETLDALAALLLRVRAASPYDDGTRNVIVPPLASGRVATLLADAGLGGAAFTQFYGRCNGFSVPDVRNGYFIHGLDLIARGAAPQRVSGRVSAPIVTIGSDGGGGLIAQRRDCDDILYLSEGLVLDRVFDSDTADVTVVAPSFEVLLVRVCADLRAWLNAIPDWAYLFG
jgi:hypothetical protein